MKPIRAILLGNGARGRIYADYALHHPGQFKIVAIADINGSGDYLNWQDALKANLSAEVAIIALPDREHCAAGIAALSKGLHVLMEKPLGCSLAECKKLESAIKKHHRFVLPCFVLRYSAHYIKLAKILASGKIGKVLSIHHLNAVSYRKSVENFCRGNWGKERTSGPMILTKSSHDLDLIATWTKGLKLTKVYSVGSHMLFKPANAPQGAKDNCMMCKLKCAYRGKGACAYKIGSDVVDHQSTLFAYKDGTTVNFELEAITAKRGRFTRFFGSKGTLLSNDDNNAEIILREFGKPDKIYSTKSTMHHGGGDNRIMSEFYKLVSSYQANDKRPLQIFNEALTSHTLAYLAERSRIGHKCN